MELTEITQEVVQKCLDWMQATENIVSEQTPLLCQEIIKYGMVHSITLIIISACLLVIGILLVKFNYRQSNWNKSFASLDDISPSKQAIFLLLGGIGFILGIVDLPVQIFTLMKIVYAPRLYLIEQLSALLK